MVNRRVHSLGYTPIENTRLFLLLRDGLPLRAAVIALRDVALHLTLNSGFALADTAEGGAHYYAGIKGVSPTDFKKKFIRVVT